jgi:hypothetical protein
MKMTSHRVRWIAVAVAFVGVMMVLAHAGIHGRSISGGKRLIDCLFNGHTGLTGALLNPTEQFVMLPFNVLEIVIRERGPLLFQLAFSDIPVAFDIERVHSSSFFSLFSFNQTQEIK